MTEPDAALTDFALGVECAALVWWLWRRAEPAPARGWLGLFLGAVGLAAVTAGTVHGFFRDAGTWAHAVLWRATLLAIGSGALAAWALGAHLLLRAEAARRVIVVVGAGYAAYAAVVVLVTQAFVVAVASYLPAALFLLIAFARTGNNAGTAGVLLTFVAAAVQVGEVGVHPRYFGHNALYHVVQGVGLWLISVAQWRPRTSAGTRAGS